MSEHGRTDDALRFGLKGVAPADAPAVWGARWIFPDDQLPDRQDAAGDEAAIGELLAWLNEHPSVPSAATRHSLNRLSLARQSARALAHAGVLNALADEQHTLYADEQGRIVANARASAGYLYVVAWLTAQQPR